MLSSIWWHLWSVWTFRGMASRSPLHPDYGKFGYIEADWFEHLEEERSKIAVAFPLRHPKALSPGSADSLARPGEVLFLLGWCQRPRRSSEWQRNVDQMKTLRLIHIEEIALSFAPNAPKDGKDGEVPC